MTGPTSEELDRLKNDQIRLNLLEKALQDPNETDYADWRILIERLSEAAGGRVRVCACFGSAYGKTVREALDNLREKS